MQLVSFRHKGLKRFYQDGITKGLSPVMADKLQKLLFALETAEALDQSLLDFLVGTCTRSKAN